MFHFATGEPEMLHVYYAWTGLVTRRLRYCYMYNAKVARLLPSVRYIKTSLPFYIYILYSMPHRRLIIEGPGFNPQLGFDFFW